jgi:hypothetical protein
MRWSSVLPGALSSDGGNGVDGCDGRAAHSWASGDSDIRALGGIAWPGAAAGMVELQAQPLPIKHLVVQMMQPLPQAQLPLHTMQQPVESSWQPLEA